MDASAEKLADYAARLRKTFDLESKGIALNFDVNCTDKTLVIADRDKLNRVITNIVYNSVKYMDKNEGKIKIQLTDTDRYIIIKIQDNGKGISKEALPFVFDRFYRADLSRNTLTGGSGLGLAISKLIIEELGGKIWAESDGPEKGSKFSFSLPKG